MTERIYYHDSYLTKFSAKVVNRQKENGFFGLVFDKTAFYPTSGGQPHDQGTVNGIPIVKVVDLNNGQILHLLEKDIKKINLKLNVVSVDRYENKKIVKELNIENVLNERIEIKLDILNENLNLDEKKLFFIIKNKNITKTKDLKINLILKNKYILENFQIIDKIANCYYIK